MSYQGLGIIIIGGKPQARPMIAAKPDKSKLHIGMGALNCPEGFELDANGICTATTAVKCPPGFYQDSPSTCAPATPEACASINAWFDPNKPDRCVKQCPEGTISDYRRICDVPQEIPVIVGGEPPGPGQPPIVVNVPAQSGSSEATPWLIGLGLVGLAVTIVGTFAKRKP
jgi:hypothetical protein